MFLVQIVKSSYGNQCMFWVWFIYKTLHNTDSIKYYKNSHSVHNIHNSIYKYITRGFTATFL